ncbi:MAG TPA: hypothetical protein VHJ38_05780 [Nitrososphaeraceae archaeon]|nr:hypothetical protein [Nitrososphaeraceae archaeon]
MKFTINKIKSLFYMITLLTFSITYINEVSQFVIAQSDESLEKMQPIPPSNMTNNQTLLGNNDIIYSVKYQVLSVAQD